MSEQYPWNKKDNLLSLCNSCNVKVNANREYWTNYFQNKLKNKNESLNDIKKKDIIKHKSSFNRFETIKTLYKTGDYTYKELMNRKNKELIKLIKEISEKKDV